MWVIAKMLLKKHMMGGLAKEINGIILQEYNRKWIQKTESVIVGR